MPTRSAHPDVTFVIPVFDSEVWISDCVTSVLAQTHVDVEVICINDGSTDGSREILAELAEADPRVRVLDQPNSGQSVGRNRGLDEAMGRYLVYLDSDDFWPSDELADLVRRADQDHIDMLLFDCAAFKDGNIEEKTWRWYASYYQRSRGYERVTTGVQKIAEMRRAKDYRPHVGLYLARTDFVRTAGVRFIPGIVHQDNPYTFRLLLDAQRVSHVRVDAYARRLRPGSTITSLDPARSVKGYYLSYLEMTRALDGHDLPAESAEMIRDIVDYVYAGAKKKFDLLSASDVSDLGELDSREDAAVVLAALRRGDDLFLS